MLWLAARSEIDSAGSEDRSQNSGDSDDMGGHDDVGNNTQASGSNLAALHAMPTPPAEGIMCRRRGLDQRRLAQMASPHAGRTRKSAAMPMA